jgi:hypothetical protein
VFRVSLIKRFVYKNTKKSDPQIREKLRRFLKKWQMRILFVDALQEEKDKQDE